VARLLVIEDDVATADLLRMVLEDAGFTLTLAPSIGLSAGGNDVDCVITDLVGVAWYTKEDARAALRPLRDRFPACPILLVTGHAGAAKDRVALGVARVIVKPFDVEQLVLAVKEATQGD
jgi:DNA-binding response OmpR family regulator